MHDISELNDQLPTSRQLGLTTLGAALVAGIILLVAVMPAEFGKDPTGLGEKLGLLTLGQPAAAAEVVIESQAQLDQVEVSSAWREDRSQLVLMPGQGAELKAIMEVGDGFVYQWQAEGAAVHFDMHGQKPNAASNDFTRYWMEDARAEAHGVFQASFAGEHGWYWENRSAEPVTITLTLKGFYDSLYMP